MTETRNSSPTSDDPVGIDGIVVGVDGSPQCEDALRWAAGQARLTGRPLHAVVAWTVPGGYGVAVMGDVDWRGDSAAVLQETVAKVLPESAGVPVQQHVLRGHPARVLTEVSAGADLLVVGCRGLGGFAGMLLGSISQHVVAHAACPVVVVHEHTDRPASDPAQP